MLINENIKSITCTDFRIFLKKLVKDKIEKEWTEDFIDQINFINSLNPPSYIDNLKIILLDKKYETITPIENAKIFVK